MFWRRLNALCFHMLGFRAFIRAYIASAPNRRRATNLCPGVQQEPLYLSNTAVLTHATCLRVIDIHILICNANTRIEVVHKNFVVGLLLYRGCHKVESLRA